MISISIASPQEIIPLDYPRLKECARTVLEGEGIKDAKVVLAFLDDAAMAAIHKRFLDEDGPTDVMTFPYSGPGARKLEGEVAIDVEVAQRECAERGHDVQAELALYVIHGMLHLCGFDDRSQKDAARMRGKEREYLKKLQLPNIADD